MKYCSKCYEEITTDTYYGYYEKKSNKPKIFCITCSFEGDI